jgi:hypothetical protein
MADDGPSVLDQVLAEAERLAVAQQVYAPPRIGPR